MHIVGASSAWSYSRTVSGFRVRWTDKLEDIERLRKLRISVFGEMDPEVTARLYRRDLVGSHLIVEKIDAGKDSGEIVGCYRLTTSVQSQEPTDFDSSDCHDIREILRRPGIQLELSYACVREDCRDGIVIRLLLSAIKKFCKDQGIHTIFGDASLNTTDPSRALRVYNILTKKESEKKEEKNLAPLLRFYFQLGAIVLAPPFFDPHFNCFDFFMMLDLGSAPEQILRQLSQL